MEKILELKDITKSYGGTCALDHMQLSVEKGTVHVLLGENGAGKSTLIKTLSGAIRPSKGSIIYEGKEYSYLEPKQAIELGIGVVYQEFNMVPYLTVADNVFLGNEPMKCRLLNKKRALEETKKVFARLGIEIDPEIQVKNLSVAYQQLVEIAKTVSKDVKLLILDEPTAALSESEVKSLLSLVKKLKSEGITVIYISHRMEELFEIADRVTVLRDGQYIDTVEISECSRDDLITKMAGRKVSEQYPTGHFSTDKVVLKVSNLRNKRLNGVSFELHEGEILGFGGLVGAGRTEVARAIFGADYAEGEIEVYGKKCRISSPNEAMKAGISFITENRKTQGLVMKQSIRENMTIAWLDHLLKGVAIDKKKEMEAVNKYKDYLKIKTPDVNHFVSSLSGGNQQKVILAKWLMTNAKILIFDEPTRGIDVGVKHEIYLLMKELARQGISIIMISSELPELIGVSDRILVMNQGRITGELKSESCTQQQVLDLAIL